MINFDETQEPCSFLDTTALTTRYMALGVVFQGPGPQDGLAVLHECGAFEVTGHSPPNFLAWNHASGLLGGGVPTGPETIHFSPPVSLVQINAGARDGGQIRMDAFDGVGGLLGGDALPMTADLQTLRIESSGGIARVVVTLPTTTFGVLDDLAFLPVSTVVTISPASGILATTQNFDVMILLEAPGLSVVGLLATLDGGDVTPSLLACAVSGTLLAGGQTFRCPGLTGGALGAGMHTLSVTFSLSDGSQVNDSVAWEVRENTEP